MAKKAKVLLDFFPYLLLTPTIVVMVLFVFYPFIESFIYSLYSLSLKNLENVHWVGFRNYLDIFSDKVFLRALLNTSYICIVAVGANILLSICLALILWQPFRGRTFILVTMLIPWALPRVVSGIIWLWIFHPLYGVLNGVLYNLKLISEYKVWMLDSFTALNLITLVLIWRTVPFMTLVLLGGLQGIPHELLDAARIDGAGKWGCFRHIILPLLKGSLAVVLTLTTIRSINIFDEVIIFTSHRRDTRSLSVQAYMTAFRFLDFGHGSAIAYTMVAISLLGGFFYVWRLYRRDSN